MRKGLSKTVIFILCAVIKEYKKIKNVSQPKPINEDAFMLYKRCMALCKWRTSCPVMAYGLLISKRLGAHFYN